MLKDVIMKYFILIIGLALAMPAVAQTRNPTWKDDVRGWFIGVDRSANDSCYMHLDYEEGGIMRVGFNIDKREIMVVLGKDSWTSLENGKLYPIAVQFGSRSPWTVEASVWEWDEGDKSLDFYLSADGNDARTFLNELQQMPNVVVRYEGKQILNLSLKGSFAAMEEVINCQINMSQNTSSNSDPFSSSSETGSDPFR